MADQPTLLAATPCVNTDSNPIVLYVHTSSDNRRTTRDLASWVKLSPFRQSISTKLGTDLLLPRLTKDRVDERLQQRCVILGSQKFHHDLLPALPAQWRIQRRQVEPNGPRVLASGSCTPLSLA
jgi:hypothetical protein